MKFLQIVHGDRVETIIGRDNAEADAIIEALVVRRVGFDGGKGRDLGMMFEAQVVTPPWHVKVDGRQPRSSPQRNV